MRAESLAGKTNGAAFPLTHSAHERRVRVGGLQNGGAVDEIPAIESVRHSVFQKLVTYQNRVVFSCVAFQAKDSKGKPRPQDQMGDLECP
jgi:hypothetical protein